MDHKKVAITVVVEIHEVRTPPDKSPVRFSQSQPGCLVLETPNGATRVIDIKRRIFVHPVRNEEILVAVGVKIRDGHAHGAARIEESRLQTHILESSITFVAEKTVKRLIIRNE